MACPIVMQKLFHKVRIEAERSHRAAQRIYLLNFISSDVHFSNRYKIDWQRGIIFLSSTIFSILRCIFAEVQFDLRADSIYRRKCVLPKHFPDINTNMLLEQHRFDFWSASCSCNLWQFSSFYLNCVIVEIIWETKLFLSLFL